MDQFLARLARPPQLETPELGSYLLIRDFLRTSFANGISRGLKPYQATYWSSGVGSSKAARGYEPSYLYPNTYSVRASVTGFTPADRCDWIVEGHPTFSASCADAVEIPIAARPDHSGSKATTVEVEVSRGGALSHRLRTVVDFPDRLILGLGESYASGEGNPDEPQTWSADLLPTVVSYWPRSPDPYERWWRNEQVLTTLTPAQWWDPVCHRSLFSQQAVASFVYSAHRPHEAVTFATFSCSGTEVLDGLLAPQLSPPGLGETDAPRGFRLAAQLEDAVNLLCRGRLVANGRRADLTAIAKATQQPRSRLESIARRSALYEPDCQGFTARKVDALLLSVGGNDVGFAGAVKDALFPRNADDPFGQFVLSRLRGLMDVTPSFVAHRRIIYHLPGLYPQVRKYLRAGIAPGETPVIQSSYPNPLFDQNHRFCDGPDDNRLFQAMHGIFPDEEVSASRRWRLRIDQSEGREVLDGLYNPLNAAVASNAGGHWSVIGFGGAFEHRGWCAGDVTERIQFAFPALRLDNKWAPFDPASWDPYAPRTRLFRTANDVVLTQISSTKSIGLGIANGSYLATSGMFHPTAQGQAIMGLSAAGELLRVLPDSRPSSAAQ